MRQLLKFAQGVQISQLGEVVRRQHETRQVREGVGERGLDHGYAVAREEERVEAFGERKVAQLLDVVVGEVYSIMRL